MRLSIKACAIAFAVFLVPFVAAPAESDPSCPQTTVNVDDFGATVNGGNPDTADIQDAIDCVALGGGGTVNFSAGQYDVTSLVQRSHVTLSGAGAATRPKLVQIAGTNASMITGYVGTGATGDIAAFSNTLTVSSATDFEAGSMVGVVAAGGASDVQTTTLSLAVTTLNASPIYVQDASEFGAGQGSFVLIDNEIIEYTQINQATNQLQNPVRPRFGTTKTAHMSGAAVRAMKRLVRPISSPPSGNTITLGGDGAPVGVDDAPVWVGSQNMTVTELHLVGKPSSEGNAYPLDYELANDVSITNNTIEGGHHGAISLRRGTANSLVDGNILTNNVTSADGAVIWLFGNTDTNTISNNIITDIRDPTANDPHGIVVDDRTVLSDEWDDPGNNNIIDNNQIDIGQGDNNGGIIVESGSTNYVTDNVVENTYYGIQIYKTEQGTTPPNPTSNSVTGNTLSGHNIGLWVKGSGNTISGNTVSGTSADDCWDFNAASNSWSSNTTDDLTCP